MEETLNHLYKIVRCAIFSLSAAYFVDSGPRGFSKCLLVWGEIMGTSMHSFMGDVLPNVVRARTSSPCELCEQEFRSRTHTCPVKKQLGLALAYRKHREKFPTSPPPVPQPPQRMEAQFTCVDFVHGSL